MNLDLELLDDSGVYDNARHREQIGSKSEKVTAAVAGQVDPVSGRPSGFAVHCLLLTSSLA